MTNFHVAPWWDMQEYRDLEYVKTYHKDLELNQRYQDHGHLESAMIIYNRFETMGLPASAEYIRGHFSDFTNVTMSAMLLLPGNYLPLHWDLYQAYQRVFDVGSRRIYRAMIMLEDSRPGQIFQLGSETWGQWSAGQVFGWYDQEHHATYNFSFYNRYAMQITATEP